ncbi:MAG TPA: gamma-glutamyltransferase [Gammaproteobacteria bacterium]
MTVTAPAARSGLRALLRPVALLAIVAVAPPAFAADRPVRAERQMVVTANPHATEAGIEILRAGGSAVDAAIAVQLVLSLVEPQSSGVGGGAFMLVYDAPDAGEGAVASSARPAELIAYEGREAAPAAATPDMFLNEDGTPMSFAQAAAGGLAVGVPGVMRMLEMAHREHGRLPWADLFAPAIELAEQGFEVSPRLHFLLDGFARFARGEKFRRMFYDEHGEARPTGYRIVNEEYAATLRLLAANGVEPMYTGELARAIVDEVRNNPLTPGRLTLEDMAAYRARETSPLCTPYRAWRVCGPRLPSSGGVTVQEILGILESFDLPAEASNEARAIHLVAEASRLAFADRNLYLADPAFVEAPVEGLLSPAYLRERAALIDPERAAPRVAPGRPQPQIAWEYASATPHKRPSTSHFSIVDAFGDAVAMTTTVQSTFGSQLMVGGFLLNNQLTDFEFEPEVDGRPVANRAEGGKRPLSSMAPTLVLDQPGRLRLVIGSPGGIRIINYVAQAIIEVLDFGSDVQAAVAAPHFVAQDGPLELESRTAILELRDELGAMGHRVIARTLNSGLHGIEIEYTDEGRVLYGGADPRREGVALGD